MKGENRLQKGYSGGYIRGRRREGFVLSFSLSGSKGP